MAVDAAGATTSAAKNRHCVCAVIELAVSPPARLPYSSPPPPTRVQSKAEVVPLTPEEIKAEYMTSARRLTCAGPAAAAHCLSFAKHAPNEHTPSHGSLVFGYSPEATTRRFACVWP